MDIGSSSSSYQPGGQGVPSETTQEVVNEAIQQAETEGKTSETESQDTSGVKDTLGIASQKQTGAQRTNGSGTSSAILGSANPEQANPASQLLASNKTGNMGKTGNVTVNDSGVTVTPPSHSQIQNMNKEFEPFASGPAPQRKEEDFSLRQNSVVSPYGSSNKDLELDDEKPGTTVGQEESGAPPPSSQGTPAGVWMEGAAVTVGLKRSNMEAGDAQKDTLRSGGETIKNTGFLSKDNSEAQLARAYQMADQQKTITDIQAGCAVAGAAASVVFSGIGATQGAKSPAAAGAWDAAGRAIDASATSAGKIGTAGMQADIAKEEAMQKRSQTFEQSMQQFISSQSQAIQQAQSSFDSIQQSDQQTHRSALGSG